jgi:Ca2+-binding RTX toxin-like protein
VASIDGTVCGGNGDEHFRLGKSAEIIDGGQGFDTIDLSSYAAKFTVDLANSANNKGAAVVADTYFGIEAVLDGTKADILVGDSGDNLLVGIKGRDDLSGGAGADTLTGGNGEDVFQFTAIQGGVDTINNVDSGHDMIYLEGSRFGQGSVKVRSRFGQGSVKVRRRARFLPVFS